MPNPSVSYVATLPLKHAGDCSLLGVSLDFTIYAEEVYGENAWLAQHALRLDGTVLRSVDEQDGVQEIEPLDLPPGLVKPRSGWHTMALNFAGPRWRGLRAPERALDLVRPLSIDEKLALIAKFKLAVPPPLLMGIAESYVLSETRIVHPNLFFVCRRARLAVALPEERLDDDHQPYDYDTEVIYVAHFYDCDQEPSLDDLLTDLTEVPLYRPMDCLLVNHHLFIADGGAGDRPSAIQVWRLELPEVVTEEEKMNKKLFG